MAAIRDLHNPWRDRMRRASFKGATFFVDQDVVASGRRVIVHEYPKRNDPYSEDMGRAARRFFVQAYLIGPDYLQLRDALLKQLQSNGPGMLRLPFPIYDGQAGDMMVMAGDFNCRTTRERGGFCEIEMQFSEYGVPGFSVSVEDVAGSVNSSADSLERNATEDLNRSLQAEP